MARRLFPHQQTIGIILTSPALRGILQKKNLYPKKTVEETVLSFNQLKCKTYIVYWLFYVHNPLVTSCCMEVSVYLYKGETYELTQRGCLPKIDRNLPELCNRGTPCETELETLKKGLKDFDNDLCNEMENGAKLLSFDACICKSDNCTPGIKNQGTAVKSIYQNRFTVLIMILGELNTFVPFSFKL